MSNKFQGYSLDGEAVFSGEEALPILTIKKKKQPTLSEKIKSKFLGKNMKLKNTSQEEFDLFTQLTANKDRSVLEVTSKEKLGLNGQSTKTIELLSFIVGKYKNKITDKFESLRVFKDVYDREDPVEVAKIITITNGKKKTVEIRFNVDPELIKTEWHNDFGLDSKPELHEAPKKVKQTKWEIMGMSEAEFNKRKIMSRLEDVIEQHPEKFDKWLTQMETL
jgi:hypothetical protein